MTVSDLDIWRSAKVLIEKHGEEAWTEAAVRYFDLKSKNDMEGMFVWRRIAQAIAEFTNTTPGKTLN